MKCDVWKPCSDQRWQDELRFSIWRFFEQSSFVNIHLLCYWPTIHNSISKICPKFQVLSSHFFKVNELLNEQWVKIVLRENISTPICVECNKMYGSKVCVQDFWYFVSGLDIQLEQSENHNPACKKTVCQFQVARYDESCTIFFNKFGMNSWVVKVSHIESGDMGSILAECRNLWLLTAVLRGTEAVSTLRCALTYCCSLHKKFFRGFSRWQSRLCWQGFNL